VLRFLARLKADSPEEQLVAKAQEGDAEAFRWLFERHVNAVRRFLGDMLPSAHLADEAAQETFVRAHRLLPRLQDRLRVKPWLLAIARLVALEQIRQQRGEAFDEDAPAVVQAVIPSPDPEAVLLKARELGLVCEPSTTSYYLGRETLLTTGKSKMMKWRKGLFSVVSRNAQTAGTYFGIPPGRVVELGMQVDL
jgi:hypothetical protein